VLRYANAPSTVENIGTSRGGKAKGSIKGTSRRNVTKFRAGRPLRKEGWGQKWKVFALYGDASKASVWEDKQRRRPG